jgi:hypothetical protein
MYRENKENLICRFDVFINIARSCDVYRAMLPVCRSWYYALVALSENSINSELLTEVRTERPPDVYPALYQLMTFKQKILLPNYFVSAPEAISSMRDDIRGRMTWAKVIRHCMVCGSMIPWLLDISDDGCKEFPRDINTYFAIVYSRYEIFRRYAAEGYDNRQCEHIPVISSYIDHTKYCHILSRSLTPDVSVLSRRTRDELRRELLELHNAYITYTSRACSCSIMRYISDH